MNTSTQSQLYDTLTKIRVTHWFCGTVSALYAWSNGLVITKADESKVRRHLKKIGYKCCISRGIIYKINHCSINL